MNSRILPDGLTSDGYVHFDLIWKGSFPVREQLLGLASVKQIDLNRSVRSCVQYERALKAV